MWTPADAYDRFMGRWSREVAATFLDALAEDPHVRWLDIGCGVGSLSRMIAERSSPASVVGVDSSAAFIAFAKSAVASPVVSFEPADATHLPFDDATFDATVSGLVLNFLPDPGRALHEALRVTRPGGRVAAYVWDYSQADFFLARLWQAVAEADGRPAPTDERHRWRVCSLDGLTELAEQSGARDWKVWPIPITTTFANTQQLWDGFMLGVGPAGAWVTGLPPQRRERLRQHFVGALPPGDGPVSLTAMALAMAGSRP